MLSSKIKLKENLFKNIDFLINKKYFNVCWYWFLFSVDYNFDNIWFVNCCHTRQCYKFSFRSYYTIKLKISRHRYIKNTLSWQKKHWRQNSKINMCIMNKVFYYYKLEENEVNKFDLLKENKSYNVLILINTWFNRPDESTSKFVLVDILSSGL